MNESAQPIAAPMHCAVVRPLHDRADRPEDADADREPNADGMRGIRNLARKPPGQCPENRERDRDEIDMDLKDLANKKRRADQIALPFHDPDKEQVQDCDTELCQRGKSKEKFEIIEEQFHFVA